MDHAEIPFLSAVELSDLLRKREVSPVEATEAYLARIEEVEPKTNAYITVCGDEALAEARRAGDEIAAGRYRGALHGVPVGIKDQIYTRGVRTTSASRLRSEFIPQEDATVVTRLRDAGAIILGKLNMAEFALGDPVNSAFGPAHNPWDLARNPGTSSTGSGAATAAFLCATSLGEDTAGSIRHPAASCGLAGLRPTWGRVSRYGVDGASWSVDTIGPISRCVADCAVTIRAIAGHDPRDPLTRDLPVPDYQRALTGDVRGLKIGLPKECFDPDEVGVGQETLESVQAAVEKLRQLGAEVREVSIPLTRHAGATIRGITHPERVSLHPEWLRERPQDFHYNSRVAFMTGNLIPAEAYYKAQKLRVMIRQQVLQALEEVDVLAQPCSTAPAAVMDMGARVESKEQASRSLLEANLRSMFSLAGVPALSVLCGFTSDGPGGLPLALQIVGKPFDEETVLRTAHAYEQNTPWHNRRPPI